MIDRRSFGRLGAGVVTATLGGSAVSASQGSAAAELPSKNAAGTIRLPARAVPLPDYLSPQAQEFAAGLPLGTSHHLPEPHNAEAWRRRAERIDGRKNPEPSDERFKSVASRQTGACSTYVIVPHQLVHAQAAACLGFHGGGLTTGGGRNCLRSGKVLALARGMETWAVDYRMPPDHPFPAAVEDGVAVYRTMLQALAPSRIIVQGSSAGGNIAAATLLRARQIGLPMPAGLLLLSPELDLAETGDSFATNMGLDVLGSLMNANLLYAAGHDLKDPLVSPLYGDVAGFPPTFVMAGTRELFQSNAVRFHRKLRDAGVYAELHMLDAGTHARFGNAPEDRSIVRDVDRFTQAALMPAAERHAALSLKL